MALHGDSTRVDAGFLNPPDDPLVLLRTWLVQAEGVGVSEPDSLILSTADSSGLPSSRVVALKHCDNAGLVFGTNGNSRKGRELAARPWAAGTLWWRETMQQMNCGGEVIRLDDSTSDALFRDRTREAQAVTTESHQSEVLEDEEALRARVQLLLDSGSPIQRPLNWSAYRLTPNWMEFWHGRPDRFHARLRYELENGVWSKKRLQP
jgi:dihydrophenazinedicarboxylate synthase